MSSTVRLVVMRGLPGSGKTTYAERWVDEAPTERVRVNRDDLRQMMSGGYVKENEVAVSAARDALVGASLGRGLSVISDDTNLPHRVVRDLWAISQQREAEFEIVDLTDIDVQTCISRDYIRGMSGGRAVGDDVITDMHNRFIRGQQHPLKFDPHVSDVTVQWVPYVPDVSKPYAFIVDIDGTVALRGARDIYDETKVYLDRPNVLVVDLVARLTAAYPGAHIIFCSGRSMKAYDQTAEWLDLHVTSQWVHLLMRAENDFRKDSVVKYELFNEHIRGNYDVLGVFDDRDQVVEMWRKLGLQVYQVAPGNF